LHPVGTSRDDLAGAWADGSTLTEGMSALYVEHASGLLGWFQSRTYSGQIAADLVSETFAVALENAQQYDPSRGASGAWLWGIARNQLRRYHRNAAVDARARARLAIQTPLVSEDDLDLIDTASDRRSIEVAIEAALEGLSPRLAAAVRSRVIDENPYDVVAEQCGCSESAARVRVSRGLSLLLDRATELRLWEVRS
jgi:RNA polymerase sigma factor (sigma-70 family)